MTGWPGQPRPTGLYPAFGFLPPAASSAVASADQFIRTTRPNGLPLDLQQLVLTETDHGYLGPNSQELPLHTGPITPEAGISIRWPESIVASKDTALMSGNMGGCALMIVQGPEKHYMAHLTLELGPEALYNDMARKIDWDLNQSTVTIVPGMFRGTHKTVRDMLDTLGRFDPALIDRVRFAHLPDTTGGYEYSYNGETRIFNHHVVSHNNTLAHLPGLSEPFPFAGEPLTGVRAA